MGWVGPYDSRHRNFSSSLQILNLFNNDYKASHLDSAPSVCKVLYMHTTGWEVKYKPYQFANEETEVQKSCITGSKASNLEG